MSVSPDSGLILTLDVGTSSVRALLFDCHGNRVPDVEAHLTHAPTTTPDGGSFLDPAFLVQQVADCIEQVSGQRTITAIATDTFWHSLLGVDAAGNPTTPVITWADTRPAAAARALRRRLPEADVHARTGCHLHSSYWPAKLTWLRQAEPEACRRTARWLSFGDYLLWRLTGQLGCSISMASGTGLLDQNTRRWDESLLAELQLEVSQLPPLVDLDQPFESGGRRWLPAIGDGAASNIGSGCATPERVAVNVGTSAAMRVVFDPGASGQVREAGLPPGNPPAASGGARVAIPSTGQVTVPPGLWCYHVDRERFVMGGALSEGGNLWAWLRATLQLPPLDQEEGHLGHMPPDGHGLTILPFIAGERSPGWSDDARLTVHGATLNTRPMDLLRASLEALAYRFAGVYEQLLPTLGQHPEVIASGAAILSSPAWLQILADVLNRPVRALDDHEATSRGAALLAWQALGGLAGLPAADFRYSATYEPDPARNAIYQAGLARQRELYSRLVS